MEIHPLLPYLADKPLPVVSLFAAVAFFGGALHFARDSITTLADWARADELTDRQEHFFREKLEQSRRFTDHCLKISGTAAALYVLLNVRIVADWTLNNDGTLERRMGTALAHLAQRYYGSYVNATDLETIAKLLGCSVETVKALYDKSGNIQEFQSALAAYKR